jgi:lipoprotein-anchoring transpeptidase ErfK/SrfK
MSNTQLRTRACAFAIFAAALVVFAGVQNPANARETVSINHDYPIGSIIIDTASRKLYYSLGHQRAIKYPVAVGKAGFQWFGDSFVQTKRKNPGWSPTARMRRMGYPRYVPPGPRNPLGPRAIYLGWTEYRIHGTNAPSSIGRAASSGCIRMHNKDVKDLYERVHIGAPVFVLRNMKDLPTKNVAEAKDVTGEEVARASSQN